MKLIDKAALVAEIERRIAFFSDINNKQVVDSNLDCAIAFAGLRDFLDTLEVKEVDLDADAICNDYIDGVRAMTDKEKLKEIKKLADAMYSAAFNLTTDTSLLRKAMKEYHQFIIMYYKE